MTRVIGIGCALAALTGCGKSKAELAREEACKQASASAASYTRILISRVQEKIRTPDDVKPFTLTPKGNPDEIFFESALLESSQLQREWLGVERSYGAGRAAVQDAMAKDLTDAATALEATAEPAGAAERVLAQIGKLEAMDEKRAHDLHEVFAKEAALLAKLDAKLAAGLKDARMQEDLAGVRETVDLAVKAGALEEKMPSPYQVDKLALGEVVTSCAAAK